MTIVLNGTNGLSDVDGTAATPAIRGTDANTGIFFGTDIIGFSEGGVEAARINADSQFVAAAGTAALPVITTTGDLNTGIFFPAADTIAFSEGGAEAMRIDASGNVGIGTASPNTKLQVAGDITMTGTAWTAYTPTITSGSGSFTTVSATGTYKTFGKTCWFTVAITVTTAGTAGGYIGVSLPFTQVASSLSSYGMEVNSTGSMVKGLNPASGVMQVTRYDNATIIGSGYLVRLTGTYETT